ncbi:MAG: DUF5916 domain-containing protein [Bacteroidota bacterium]
MRSVLLLLAFTAASVSAQPDPYTLAAAPVEAGAIRLDGVLDEPAWATAEAATDFVQFRPSPGEAASEATVGRVLVGPSALYIGMRMEDRQASAIDARLARRDEGVSSDHCAIVIDSYDDDRTAFFFRVSPGRVMMDILFYDDIEADRSWDAVWDVATTRDAAGWTAEFEIPLSQLRYRGGAGPHTWGFQLARIHFRTNELSYWTPRRPEDTGYVSQFGRLTIPGDLPSPRRLEAVPYVASAVTRAPGDAADPFYAETDLEPRLGLDLKLGVTSGLTLAATVNPDFGQVEADPAQVNLGGFELFFQERRPFFLEGLDAFSTAPRRALNNRRPTLLYTRRIGRAPQRTAFVPASVGEAAGETGAVYTDAPQQSTILGAGKLSGQVGRFSVGLLNATTRAETGRFRAFDAAGAPVADDRATVEPLSNYLVARSRGTFGRTIVGGLVTSVVRDTGDPDLAALLPTTATVAGLDVEHDLGADWLLTGQVAGSALTGTEDAILREQTAFPRLFQRPDADHLGVDSSRTALTGWAAEANLIKTDGDRWLGALHAGVTSPGFDANALGFQPRADYAHLDGQIEYRQTTAQGPFQQWQATASGGAAWNLGGDRIGTLLAWNAFGVLRNFWSVGLSGDVVSRFGEDRLTRGGPMVERDAGGALFVNVESDSRKPVVVEASAGAFGNELGRLGVSADVGISAQPSSAVSVSVVPGVQLYRDPRQFVTAVDDPEAVGTFGRRTVFGDIDQTTLVLETRLDWTFTPTLTLQLFARPFLSRGQYTSFSALDAPGAFRFPTYGVDFGTATANADGSTTLDAGDGGAPVTVQPDFTVRSLRGNAVLRWEYRPGSTLFLVWQQQRDGVEADGRFEVRRDVRGVLTDPVTNVFLVKLSYWLG